MAERVYENLSRASEPSAIVAVIGPDDDGRRWLSDRLTGLLPTTWSCRHFREFDNAIDSNSPTAALIALVGHHGAEFDNAGLAERVEQVGSAPLIVAGDEPHLPSEIACLRAGVAQRINQAESADLIDARLNRAIDQAVERRRLAELERRAGPAPIADARASLHRHLARVSGRSEAGRSRGLIFVAVDGVPGLQQQLGLAGADARLEDVGLFLIDQLADTDRCFRFAVGEYVLSVARAMAGDVADAARMLVHAISDTEFKDPKRTARVTASVSSVTLGGDSASNDRCLQELASVAYAIRETGGNDYRAYESAPVDDTEPAPDAWRSRLQQALQHDRFRLAFQTVSSLAGDHRRYYDVLLRYVDEDDALRMPADFLPAAEAAGLMPDIDRWVAQRAAQVIADQAARSMEVALFVKLSPPTVDDARAFTEWLEAESAIGNIERQQLIFCVRESDARTRVAATRWLAGALDQAGFRFALTHFGQDASQTAMLDNMTLSFIKLAPAFARRLAEQNTGDERLQQIIDYARRHQVPLIAEHIEDAASMARLWQAGVNYVQGHFIQEPDPAAIPGNGAG